MFGLPDFNFFGYAPPWSEAEPAAYFRCVTPKDELTYVPGGFNWPQAWRDGDENFFRWATEACFNPVYTPFKLGAISLVDAFAEFSANRVGVVFTPGDAFGRGYSFLRRVHPRPDEPEMPAGYPADRNGAEAYWDSVGYRNYEVPFDNNACVAFSQLGFGDGATFEVPERSLSARGRGVCGTPIDEICGDTHEPERMLSSCYFENEISVREAIYWHAAKRRSSLSTGTPDIARSLWAAIDDLKSDRGNTAVGRSAEIRGGMALTAHRWIVLLTDYLSGVDADEKQQLQNAFASLGVRVAIISYGHERLSADQRAALDEQAAEFAALDAVARVYSVNSAEDLERVVPIVLGSLRAVVRRS